ncbi:minor capsid protein [Companilactobacillus allii]|uniref:Phage head morphogenesis domain-containing protein n=1 Tax=Companilactobacillus allii TaxID=1847728 RepID=A0A1P8Q4E9_9LACO|nr:minor capsid protein [Companilactobacillus allii]APX72707.1 hypothetical protein BTM29_09155 [Companilactobacillus allii]USQ69813.1 minor capsid protein [Companilactobacillus allii]
MKMDNLTYWEKRFLQTKASQLKSTEEYERALQPQLKGLLKQIDLEANQYYRRYSINNGIPEEEVRKILNNIGNSNWNMTLDQFTQKAIEGGHKKELDNEYFKSRIARLQNLETQIKDSAGYFAKGEESRMGDALAAQYKDSYMRTIYKSQSAQFKYSANFAHFNDDQLKVIASKPWIENNFSKRIWKNYRDVLPDKLMDTMLRGTLLGYAPSKISNMLHARFQDISKKDIHRLVFSEMGYISEEATAKGYAESGIEKYEYMATLESHTCDICAKLDNQVFKLSERKDGINYPTIHAYCRCTTVPYIDDLPDVGERWTSGDGKIENNLSFKEWNKKYGENISVNTDEIKKIGIDPHDKSKWPKGIDVVETVDGDMINFNSDKGMRVSREWLNKLLRYKDDSDLIEYIEYQFGDGRFTDIAKTKNVVDWVKEVRSFKEINQNSVLNTRNNKFKIEDIRPKRITDFNFDNFSRKQLTTYIENEFGMTISESKNEKLSDLAILETVKTVSEFKGLYQALPEKIPMLRAMGSKEAGGAIAWYSRNGSTNSPLEFALNTHYFYDKAMLTNTVKQNVQVGWFSNNDEMNHIMIHEFSHHIDKQLSKLINNKSFSTRLFRTIENDYSDFNVKNIGKYAYESYEKQSDYTEPFAELFTEAYGPTPGKQALIFKKYFEEMSLEVLNNA